MNIDAVAQKDNKWTTYIAKIFKETREKSYDLYNKQYEKSGMINTRESFEKILNDYLRQIVKGMEKEDIVEKIKLLGKSAVEHLTGNYEIGIGEIGFEELADYSETISTIVAYSDKKELIHLLDNKKEKELSEGIVDGTVAYSLIPSQDEEKAKLNFKNSAEIVKKFFKDSIYNISKINQIFANTIAHLAEMDKEESKGLNNNILGKFIGGIGYEFLSGTLISKRHFTDVVNSPSMQEKIQEEGILYFTSPSNIDKILKSQKIKPSSFLESDLTKKKSFFFAGTPTFEDLLINIPAYDVMTAIRIKPTEEQVKQLKYRALNDRAVTKDGAFEFNKEQVEIAYFGLMWDKEKDNIYLGELTEEQAKDFQVSDEVRQSYHYEQKNNSILDNIKMNAYGFYAEYKHHQKLLQIEGQLRQKGINSFRNVDDSILEQLHYMEQAYISKSAIERRDFLQTVREKMKKDKSKEVIKGEIEIG